MVLWIEWISGMNMDVQNFVSQYWPMLALVLWFGYKWWNSKRVVAMLPALKAQGALLLDVRSAGEFASANAPGTVNIPLNELGSRLAEVPKNAPVVVCCASGSRSGMARMMLKKNGYADVHNVGSWTKLL
jgi:phage shock protein E